MAPVRERMVEAVNKMVMVVANKPLVLVSDQDQRHMAQESVLLALPTLMNPNPEQEEPDRA